MYVVQDKMSSWECSGNCYHGASFIIKGRKVTFVESEKGGSNWLLNEQSGNGYWISDTVFILRVLVKYDPDTNMGLDAKNWAKAFERLGANYQR